jgi:hypothetical protein
MVLGVTLAASTVGCDGDRCLAYSDYGPPSLRLALVDAATGEALCSRSDYIVRTSRGDAIPHEDTCEWWLPQWTLQGDAGANATASDIELTVTGYLPRTVSVDISRNDCGEIQAPPLLRIDVEPDPAPAE